MRWTTARPMVSAALASVGLAGTGSVETSRRAPAGLPPRLESYLTSDVKPAAEDRQRLLDGASVTKLIGGDETREVGVRRGLDCSAQGALCGGRAGHQNFERGGAFRGGLAPVRDSMDRSRPTFVAREFQSMMDEMPSLTTYMPSLRQYLLDYPRATLPDATSFLYWQDTQFGLKPTLRISHLVIREGADDTVVASKMLYASHYFWTALELRALLPDPARGPGFRFITVNRSRSDGLSGFRGFFVRRRVRGEVQEGLAAVLESTKRRLEGTR